MILHYDNPPLAVRLSIFSEKNSGQEAVILLPDVIKLPGMQLLDYFAIQPELRGTGIGTSFLHILAESCGTDCVLLETKDPDISSMRTQNADCRNTGIRSEIWGVPYRVFLLSGTTEHPEEIYATLYRHMLPPQLYQTKVRIRTIIQ